LQFWRSDLFAREFRGRLHSPRSHAIARVFTLDRENDFVPMPLVIRPWTITADAICEMSSKAIYPKPDRFPADDLSPLSQQILSIGCGQAEPVMRPDGINNDLTRITEAFQAQQSGRHVHRAGTPSSRPANSLAIPPLNHLARRTVAHWSFLSDIQHNGTQIADGGQRVVVGRDLLGDFDDG
jgi:hypothetical protein